MPNIGVCLFDDIFVYVYSKHGFQIYPYQTASFRTK